MPHVPSVGMGRGWLESFAVETCRKMQKGIDYCWSPTGGQPSIVKSSDTNSKLIVKIIVYFFPKAQGWSLDTFLQKEPIPHPPLLNKNWAIFMR